MRENITQIDCQGLAGYSYLGLYDIGLPASKAGKDEYNWLNLMLSKFLGEKCLMVSAVELKNAPETSFVKSIYNSIFNCSDKLDKYIAAISLNALHSRSLPPKPIFQSLQWNSDSPPSSFSRLAVLINALERLSSNLHFQTLEKFPLPRLDLKQEALLCPYGSKIKGLRGERRSLIGIERDCLENKKKQNLKRSTLGKAEENEPISRTILYEIAEYHRVSHEDIIFKQVVPIPGRLKELRLLIGKGQDELAQEFDLLSGSFFDLLEKATAVPADKIIFIYKRYAKILEGKLVSFESLLDILETEKLANASQIGGIRP